MSSTLVVVRHGESDWNLKNLFSGWKDIHLSVNGKKEARRAGQLLKREGIDFDISVPLSGMASELIEPPGRSLSLPETFR